MIRFVIQELRAWTSSGWNYRGVVATSTKTGKRQCIADMSHNAVHELRNVGLAWSEVLRIETQMSVREFKQWEKHNNCLSQSPINDKWVRSMERKNGKAGN